jgi:hypothetical protein
MRRADFALLFLTAAFLTVIGAPASYTEQSQSGERRQPDRRALHTCA